MPKERLAPEEAYKEGQLLQSRAEQLARHDKEKSPANKHYQEASQDVDALRKFNPELAEGLAESVTKGREWVNAIGADMYEKMTKLLEKAWWESVDAQDEKKEFSRKLALEATRQKMMKRIVLLFKGKEHLLPIAKEIVDDFVDHNTDKESPIEN